MSYRYKLIISYDGYDYAGFQHQEGFVTIEGVITKTLFNIFNKDIKIIGSGRTDKMVHARGQVIAFDLDFKIKEYNLLKLLNTYLPLSIRVSHVYLVDNDFHPRFNALSKIYSYKFSLHELDAFNYRYALYIKNLDYNKIIEALPLFIGKQDFKSLCSADIDKRKPTIKEIYNINYTLDDNYFIIYFHGDGFLKYQVRRMVGLLVDIGLNKKKSSDIQKILNAKDPRLSHRMVSGNALCLEHVYY